MPGSNPEISDWPTLFSWLKITSHSSVSVIGSGGKHTLLHYLAKESQNAGLSAIVTSSTRLHRPDHNRQPLLLVAENNDKWPEKLLRELQSGKIVYLLEQSQANSMLGGFSKKELQDIRLQFPDTTMFIKADGARKRSLKFPSRHEPSIPSFTDLCILVVGIDCIGKTLDKEHAHRPELIVSTLGIPLHTVITPQIVTRLLIHPQGYVSRLPQPCTTMLYLSKTSTPEDQDHAREIIEHLPFGTFDFMVSGDTKKGSIHLLRSDNDRL